MPFKHFQFISGNVQRRVPLQLNGLNLYKPKTFRRSYTSIFLQKWEASGLQQKWDSNFWNHMESYDHGNVSYKYLSVCRYESIAVRLQQLVETSITLLYKVPFLQTQFFPLLLLRDVQLFLSATVNKSLSKILATAPSQATGITLTISLMLTTVRSTDSNAHGIISLLCHVAFDNHIEPCTSNNMYFYGLINPLLETKWVIMW